MVKITLIEDDKDLRHLLQAALNSHHYEVTSFDNGDNFLQTIHNTQPSDFYVIDLNLGGITGYEVCQKIKTLNPKAVVILISANPEVEERAAEVCADGYMMKPFAQKALVEKIRSFLKKSHHS